jgi:hypothetical protein
MAAFIGIDKKVIHIQNISSVVVGHSLLRYRTQQNVQARKKAE